MLVLELFFLSLLFLVFFSFFLLFLFSFFSIRFFFCLARGDG